MPQGLISKGIGGFYYIKTETGLYETKARGIFRKNEIVPLPGDRVNIDIVDETRKIGHIIEILERDTVLKRPAVANVNQMVIVMTVTEPPCDFYLLDKLLITANIKKIEPVVCINKIDLNKEENYLKIGKMYSNIGYKVFYTSFKTREGYNILKEILSNRITVFAGQSGVGKSTILNNIINKLVMETSEVSKKIKRGRHTTRHAELLQLKDGGFVVDTPGFSSFSLDNVSFDDLKYYYPEFDDNTNDCKFFGCSHIDEPLCGVKEALKKGLVDEDRYKRYIVFYNELKNIDNMKWKKRRRK